MGEFLDELATVARGWRWTRRPLTPRSAERFAPEPEDSVFPTAWTRTPAARAVRNAIHKYALKPLIWNETAPKVSGLDNLERVEGPVMFFSNHSSHLDASLILCSLPPEWREKTAVGAAADYFFDAWWKSAGTSLVYNAFPIERSSRRSVTDAARELVGQGYSLVVFPEGTRSPDGWMQRFRLGASRLCIDLQIPAVPIGIRGAYSAMPRGSTWPLRGRLPVSVRFGTAVVPEPNEDHRSFSKRLTQGVSSLIDEDRTTWWEAMQRAVRGETRPASGPAGPKWRRVWEASRPIAARRPRRAWR
ncbi:MAG: lysophospholipid acyltransferase family protein [Actinomycetota bacterium]